MALTRCPEELGEQLELTGDFGKPGRSSCRDETAECWWSPLQGVASVSSGGSWVTIDMQAISWEEMNLEWRRMDPSWNPLASPLCLSHVTTLTLGTHGYFSSGIQMSSYFLWARSDLESYREGVLGNLVLVLPTTKYHTTWFFFLTMLIHPELQVRDAPIPRLCPMEPIHS